MRFWVLQRGCGKLFFVGVRGGKGRDVNFFKQTLLVGFKNELNLLFSWLSSFFPVPGAGWGENGKQPNIFHFTLYKNNSLMKMLWKTGGKMYHFNWLCYLLLEHWTCDMNFVALSLFFQYFFPLKLSVLLFRSLHVSHLGVWWFLFLSFLSTWTTFQEVVKAELMSYFAAAWQSARSWQFSEGYQHQKRDAWTLCIIICSLFTTEVKHD